MIRNDFWPAVAPGQSHKSILLTRLIPISFAPEAQRSLAPRFSVGKAVSVFFVHAIALAMVLASTLLL